jgi:replicative DNA helicase
VGTNSNLKIPTEILEELILSYCIKNATFFIKIKDHLDTRNKDFSYFNDTKKQKVFNLLAAFFDKYDKLPKKETLFSIIEKLEKDDEIKLYTLAITKKMYENEESLDSDYIEEETLKFIKEAKAYEVIISSSSYIKDENYSGLIDDIENIAKISFDEDLGTSIKEYDKIYDMFQSLTNEGAISTGYRNLDSLMDGGFHNQELYVFSSTPGVGKCLRGDVEIEVEYETNEFGHIV